MKIRICQLALVVAAAFGSLANPLMAQVNVTTYHNDLSRTGQNTQETILTPANVNSAGFGKLFSVSVDGWVYAQPLYLSNVSIAGGTHNVLYVATEHDSVYAIDADSGSVLWHASYIPSGGATFNTGTDLNCGDLVPEVGITGTPAIDANTGTIYFVAKSKVSGSYYQYLHAVDVTTGAEKFGGPARIQASVPGTAVDGNGTTVTFSPYSQHQRAALLLENGHVVIGWGSHCDISPWHGWVMSYSAANLSQEAVFNASPNGYASGVWMAGSGIAADANGSIYFATGNGTFDGATNYGDSIVKLGPPGGGTFPVQDYFTPFDQAYLSGNDLDVASGGLILLPPLANGRQLLVQQSKEGTIFLLDTANLGKTCSPACTTGDTQIVQEIQNATVGIWGAPAYWNGNVYWAGGNDNTLAPDYLKAFSFNANGSGLLSTIPTSHSAKQFGFSAPVPAVSANGTTNGIVWALDDSEYQGQCTPSAGTCQTLYAYDATNLAAMLYNSNQAANFRDVPGGAVKFATPIIANGKVYFGSQYSVSGYGLLNFTATPTFVSPAPGTYSSAQSVVLADATSGSSIYYTTDGTTPTSASALYTGSIQVSTTTTIKAIATAPGLANSTVAAATYTISASQTTATPTFSPTPATYATAQSITLSDATPSARMYFTLDGTSPSTASTAYTGPITVNSTTTIKVLAVATGLANSAVATGTYIINSNPLAPVDVTLPATANVYAIGNNGSATIGGGFDGGGYAYSSALLGPTVTWSGVSFSLGGAQTADAVSAATISLPAGTYSTLYLLGAAINGNQPNQAFTVNYSDGTTSSFAQGVSDWYTPQNYSGESQAVTMPYRIAPDGSLDNRVFYLYGYSFGLNAAKVVKSITLPNNRSVNIVAIALAPSVPTTATPTFSPTAGTYPAAQTVTMSDATSGSAIYYTSDGTMPTTASTPYVGPIQVSTTTTLRAIAATVGYNNSAVASAVFTINVPAAATPVLNPTPGSYTAAQSVTLSDATSGSSLYYTLDGSTPTTSSTPYAGPIAISATTTIRAIAAASGYSNSAVAGGIYTISTNPLATIDVPLPSAANVYAIGVNGSASLGGGFDGGGYTYSSTLLGTSVNWSGINFSLGAALSADAISAATVGLPVNSYSTIYLLGAAINGNQPGQAFVVTYTDGTTSTFTQSVSDWFTPQNYSGESQALMMAYRLAPDGSIDNRNFYLYGYSFPLNAAKSVQSITLPNNHSVNILAIALTPTGPTTAAPAFSPAPGTFTSAQSVSLSDSTPGAAIYYTTNGTTPTTASTLYSAPIPVTSTTTINAIGVLTGNANSTIATGTYTIALPAAPAPTFSPVPGTYSASQTVSLADTGTGVNIYYTTNGTTPTTTSSLYTGPITVSATTTIKAIASGGNYSSSPVSSGIFTISVPVAATPTFSPAAGSYTSAQLVTLSDTTAGAAVHYTLDGTTPTAASTLYTGSITISTTTTIKAIAVATGFANSAAATGTFTITAGTAAAPTFSPMPATYATAQSVTLTDSTPGAAIYFTVDGTTPTTASALYTSAIPVSASVTIKAIAAATGYTNSSIATGTYTISAGGSPVSVPLTGSNLYGIGIDGATVPGTGIDGGGQAYSGTLLGRSTTWGGIPFNFGTAGALDVLTNSTLTLPTGNYSKLWILATGVNGNQKSQAFVVTYTDATTTTFTQSLSDWYSPQNYAGENKVLTEAYRLLSNGSQDARTFYLYGYGFTLNSSKTIKSIKLPSNKNVVVLALTLSP